MENGLFLVHVFSKKVKLLITAKQKLQRKIAQPASLCYSTSQFVVVSLCYVSLRHNDMKFSAAFFFLKGFSAKHHKMPKETNITTAL